MTKPELALEQRGSGAQALRHPTTLPVTHGVMCGSQAWLPSGDRRDTLTEPLSFSEVLTSTISMSTNDDGEQLAPMLRMEK